jgi:hypothetical protein
MSGLGIVTRRRSIVTSGAQSTRRAKLSTGDAASWRATDDSRRQILYDIWRRRADDGKTTRTIQWRRQLAKARRRISDYLLIEGDNIANILFDPSAETIKVSDEGFKALMRALQDERSQDLLIREGQAGFFI